MVEMYIQECIPYSETLHKNFSFIILTESHSHDNLNRVIEANDHLCQLYDRLKAEELEAKLKKVEEAHTKRAYSESWKLINDITDQVQPSQVRYKGRRG